ncbi:MAG: hypothetical protein U5K72_19745 [Balneolaceae bacterium]|nr:hypothetical protein [Balneolaceae bacterium]
MTEIQPNLFIGNENDYEFNVKDQEGWSVVHACKEPYHRQALGYSGRGAPKDHPEYLMAKRENRLILKLVIEKERVLTENWNKPHGRGNIDPENFSPYPKNPMIARFFKEIGRVDELGSGVRNTYKYCGLYTPGTKPEFIEGDVFKAIIPIQTEQVSGEATGEVSGEVQKVVSALEAAMKRSEIQNKLELKHDDYFRLNYIEPAIKEGFIEMTYPNSPNHPNQKYRLTAKGKKLKTRMEKK